MSSDEGSKITYSDDYVKDLLEHYKKVNKLSDEKIIPIEKLSVFFEEYKRLSKFNKERSRLKDISREDITEDTSDDESKKPESVLKKKEIMYDQFDEEFNDRNFKMMEEEEDLEIKLISNRHNLISGKLDAYIPYYIALYGYNEENSTKTFERNMFFKLCWFAVDKIDYHQYCMGDEISGAYTEISKKYDKYNILDYISIRQDEFTLREFCENKFRAVIGKCLFRMIHMVSQYDYNATEISIFNKYKDPDSDKVILEPIDMNTSDLKSIKSIYIRIKFKFPTEAMQDIVWSAMSGLMDTYQFYIKYEREAIRMIKNKLNVYFIKKISDEKISMSTILREPECEF